MPVVIEFHEMAARAPKQWCLSEHETITTFESWKSNLIYILTLDTNFADFLVESFVWGKRTTANPLCGFTEDGASVPEPRR